jgi:hypothetical protein
MTMLILEIKDNKVFSQTTVKEYVNVDVLNKLLNSKVLQQIDWDGFKHEKTQLQKLKSQLVDNHTSIQFKSKIGYGRVHPKNKKISLGTLRRQIRHTLCRDDYFDIDMVNAQPTIYNDILKSAGINNECINTYVMNREEILKNIMECFKCTREQSKNLIIAFINGGSLNKWIEKNEIAESFDKESDTFKYVSKLQDEIRVSNSIIIASNPKAIAILKKAKKDEYKGDYTFISHFLGEYEKSLIEYTIYFLTQRDMIKHNIFVYCQDGIMVLKKYFKFDIMKEIENEFEKIGFSIKFKIKEMDEGYSNDELNDNLSYIVRNDNEAGEIIRKLLKGNIIKCNEQRFIKNKNKWVVDSPKDDTLLNIVLNTKIYKEGKKGLVEFSGDVRGANSIITAMWAGLEEDNLFYNKIQESTKGKLCFTNGVLNIITKEFKLWDNCNDIYTFVVIPRDYQKADLKSVETVKQKIFKDILGDEQYEDFLKFLSRRMAGFIEDKDWAIFLGMRNCGKGVIGCLLENTFERYINTINSGNFILKSGVQDEAKNQSWMLDCQFSRLSITNEIKLDKKQEIDGNSIKKFNSGGDTITARKNHKDEVSFKVSSGLLMFCNDVPAIKPKDTLETCIQFNGVSKFESQNFINERKEKGATENEINMYKIADNTIKDKCRGKEWLNAMIELVLQYFIPEKVQLSQSTLDKNTLTEGENDMDLIYDNFEITNEDDDIIDNKDLKDWITKQEINISLSKLTLQLIQIGAKNYKNGKKNIRGLKNIKLKC